MGSAATPLGYVNRMGTEQQEQLSAEEARELVARNELQALDIRESEDWEKRHIPGALHIPAAELDRRADELPGEGRIVVVCGDGKRSSEVAATLRGRGRDAVSIDGGMKAWEKENLPLQPSTDPSSPVEPGAERL